LTVWVWCAALAAAGCAPGAQPPEDAGAAPDAATRGDASTDEPDAADELDVLAVAVAGDEVVAEVSERYLSFAIDVAQVVGGVFWSPGGGVEGGVGTTRVPPYDFTSSRVRVLAGALAPTMMRIGGSEADRIYYDLSDDPGEAPEGFEEVLTRAQWDGMADFARELDIELFFTLNAGPGWRAEPGGPWDPEGVRELITYAEGRGDPVVVWELGNEINAFPAIHGLEGRVTAAQYVEDVRAARGLLDELGVDGWLAGPSSAFWPRAGEINPIYEDFMELGGGASLDLITWHYYPQQSTRCPAASRRAIPETMLNVINLNEAAQWAEQVEAARDLHAPGTPVWLGESGHAQCGGQPGVSDTYASGFWWLDQLGLLARRRQGVLIRQTLSGSDYGMLDDVTLEPRPDYWTALLWRRLMGTKVLDATSAESGRMRAWSHCMRGVPGGVAVAWIHLDRERSGVLEVQGVAGDGALYALTAPELTSPTVDLNGETLALGEQDALPALEGAPMEGNRATVPPTSYGFVVFPQADAAACR
jgi:heparanase 1